MSNIEQIAVSVEQEAKRRLFRYFGAVLIAVLLVIGYRVLYLERPFDSVIDMLMTVFILFVGFFVEFTIFRKILRDKTKGAAK